MQRSYLPCLKTSPSRISSHSGTPLLQTQLLLCLWALRSRPLHRPQDPTEQGAHRDLPPAVLCLPGRCAPPLIPVLPGSPVGFCASQHQLSSWVSKAVFSILFLVCAGRLWGGGYGCELELFACFLFIIQRGKSKQQQWQSGRMNDKFALQSKLIFPFAIAFLPPTQQ